MNYAMTPPYSISGPEHSTVKRGSHSSSIRVSLLSTEVAARIERAARGASIDGERSPDLLALTGPLHPDEETVLAERCAAVFSRRRAPERFARLAQLDERSVDLLRSLLTIGHAAIEEPAAPATYSDGSAAVSFTMGRHSYCAEPPQLIAYADGRCVEIGSSCSISGNVRFFLDEGHRADLITTSPLHSLGLPGPPGHNLSKGPIVIRHDVRIGHSATILPGVTIGTGAVVGTGTVVASDVRPYAVVVGNPAREIKRRFTHDECELLLPWDWWEWSDDKLRAALNDLWSSDVRTFVSRWAR
jgi:acetyltransferase-like isoleucine patch superfamily enzyme